MTTQIYDLMHEISTRTKFETSCLKTPHVLFRYPRPKCGHILFFLLIGKLTNPKIEMHTQRDSCSAQGLQENFDHLVRNTLLYIPEQTYPSRSRTRYAKKNKNDTFRTRYAKKQNSVPLKLGGSVFEAAEGLREFRVPGTRFFLFGEREGALDCRTIDLDEDQNNYKHTIRHIKRPTQCHTHIGGYVFERGSAHVFHILNEVCRTLFRDVVSTRFEHDTEYRSDP